MFSMTFSTNVHGDLNLYTLYNVYSVYTLYMCTVCKYIFTGCTACMCVQFIASVSVPPCMYTVYMYTVYS